MEALSPFHLIIILAVIVLLFGGKKIPEVMRGLGEGIRNFQRWHERAASELAQRESAGKSSGSCADGASGAGRN